MEGYTNEEIAAQRNCALSTVERRLRLIRKRWEKQLVESEEVHQKIAQPPPGRL